jgi:small subunit ribosomal protein S14
MARTALRNKAKAKPKYKVRAYTRCELCGRPRAVYRKFKICRCCFRKLASEGRIPGVRKSSW